MTDDPQPDDFRALQRNQAYDFYVELEVPDSRTNRKSGVFMVELYLSSSLHEVRQGVQSTQPMMTQLAWQPDASSIGASRPAYIHYQSFVFRLARKLVFFVPYLVGWWTETVPLNVPVMSDTYDRNTTHPLQYAAVRITSPSLQVYSAALVARAKMTGIVYARHHVGIVALMVAGSSCTTGSSAAMCSGSTSRHGPCWPAWLPWPCSSLPEMWDRVAFPSAFTCRSC